MQDTQTAKSQGGALEIVTVVLMILSPILSLVSWLIAAVLLWISDYWRLSDRLIGTLVPPVFMIGIAVVTGMFGLGMPVQDWIRIPMMFSFAFLPTLTGIYLAFRYRFLRPKPAPADVVAAPGLS